MQAIAQKYGPESMALISHGLGGTFLKHLMKAYGTPNMAAPSFAQCRGPRDVGFRLTFGDDPGSPERTDIANARCLVLIGSHLGENMHNTQVQEFAQAIENDCHVIVVDPRFSVAASKARHYLPIRPGTDLALLLAWINVLITEKLYDAEYLAQHAVGFEQLAAYVAPFTPEWAYPETGIAAASVIRETARVMARAKPATLVHPGRHAVWYGDDAQRSRAVAILNALLGSWGRKGGFYVPASMDLPGYPYPPYPHGERGKVDNPDKKYPFAHDTISTGIRSAALTGKPYPIKGLMTYATNLIYALPNEAETIEAFKQLDLLAVVDVAPSETAGWADVVLPESTYLERYDDLNVELFRDPFIALAPARGGLAPRPEAELVDRPRARPAAGSGEVLPLAGHRDLSADPAREGRLLPRGAEEERHHRGAQTPGVLRGRRPRRVQHPHGQDRTLVDRAAEVLGRTRESARLRAAAALHAARAQPAGQLSPALRTRADPHLQPHADQPAARRRDARERAVAQRRTRRNAWV